MWIRTVNGIRWIEVQFTSQGLIYPKQTNEHNALADVKCNYELYKFLNTLNVKQFIVNTDTFLKIIQ